MFKILCQYIHQNSNIICSNYFKNTQFKILIAKYAIGCIINITSQIIMFNMKKRIFNFQILIRAYLLVPKKQIQMFKVLI